MRKIAIGIFAIFYISGIVVKIHSIIEVSKCIKKLNRFIEAFKHKGQWVFSNSDIYRKELNALLSYSPVIEKYYNSGNCKLSNKYDDYTNHENAEKLYNVFLDIKLYTVYELKCAINPVSGIKAVLIFPATLLSWFRIRIRPSQGIFITLFFGFATYLLDMFKPEIKSLFISLLEYLIQTYKP